MKYLVLTICLLSAACATTPKSEAIKNPLLLEISKDGKSHYILGTIHIPLDVEKMYPALYTRLDESTVFIYESDTHKMEKMSYAELKKGSLYYKNENDGKLENDLSPGAFKFAKDNLSYFNSDFATLKPQGAYDLIIERREKFQAAKPLAPLKKELVVRPQNIYRADGKLYDVQLADYAAAHKKKILFLDDTDAPLMEKCHQLTAVVKLEQMAVDEKAITTDQFLKEAQTKSSTCLLKERNQAWMKILKPVFTGNDKAFVAVGMGHLGLGDSTLLQMLAAEGYILKSIGPDGEQLPH